MGGDHFIYPTITLLHLGWMFTTFFSSQGWIFVQGHKFPNKRFYIVTKEELPLCDPRSLHFALLSISPQHPVLHRHFPVGNMRVQLMFVSLPECFSGSSLLCGTTTEFPNVTTVKIWHFKVTRKLCIKSWHFNFWTLTLKIGCKSFWVLLLPPSVTVGTLVPCNWLCTSFWNNWILRSVNCWEG